MVCVRRRVSFFETRRNSSSPLLVAFQLVFFHPPSSLFPFPPALRLRPSLSLSPTRASLRFTCSPSSRLFSSSSASPPPLKRELTSSHALEISQPRGSKARDALEVLTSKTTPSVKWLQQEEEVGYYVNGRQCYTCRE